MMWFQFQPLNFFFVFFAFFNLILIKYSEFELSSTPPALFDGNCMRKTQKSILNTLFPHNTAEEINLQPAEFVIDGGYLLHSVVWPKVATYKAICQIYVNHVIKQNTNDVVVFYGYSAVTSTKSEEQSRRSRNKMCPDIIFNEETCVNTLHADLLSNKRNKARLISMVSNFLKMGGVNVDQAQDDADELIVSTALSLHQLNKKVVVLATDTDILTMLIARAPTDNNIFVLHPATSKTPAKVFVVDEIQKNIGVMKEAVLFAHAISGCGKTCALYNKGKKSSYNLLQKSKSLREKVCRIFHTPNRRKNEVVAVGEEFVRALYPDGQEFSNINQLRHHLYNIMIVKQSAASLMELSNLPPTKAATEQHHLRVYLQVQEWLGNPYPPTEWGWKLIQDQLLPIPTTLPPAPESLLRLIHCQCKSTCAGRCSCRNSGQKCSIKNVVATCKGEICTNTDKSSIAYDFEEEEDI